jgi:outer membrane protein
MSFRYGLVLVFSLFIFSQSALAAMNIAIVDLQRALVMVNEGKSAKKRLQKEVDSKQSALKKEEAAIKKEIENFKKQSGVLSEKARQKKQMTLQEKLMKFTQKAQATQMKLQQREKSLTEPIIKKLRSTIDKYAKKNKYTLILEKNESGVLFHSDVKDITKDIISAYNKSK